MGDLNRRGLIGAAAAAVLAPIPAMSMAQPAMTADVDPAAFIADLIRADLTVLASPSGKLELLAYQSVRDPDGGGYREVPRHPDADTMAARFYALTERERAAVVDFVLMRPWGGEGAR